MACAKPSNCQPCSPCAETPAPVMPRCDIVLTDGTYINATIVVEDGCIVDVQEGSAPVYSPDVCCAPVGAGGGGDGLDGGEGPPGQNATIAIGTVSSLPYGSAPTVTNTGSATNAILNFGIPRGEPGDDGDSVEGATSSLAGIQLVNGLIEEPLPITWPPVLSISWDTPNPVVGMILAVTKDDSTGEVELLFDLSIYAEDVQDQLDDLDARVSDVETMPSFTVATLPSAAANARKWIYVSDETGGATPAFSDGTNWRRCTDLAVVS